MKTHLGHYEIVAELGRGGMGVVYKGYEPSLARYVAIKELSPTLAHDPLVVERFLREARSMALLSEPHIVQIHFIGQENEQPFIVMEFIDGVPVAALIKRDGRLDTSDALKIVLQTAQGLSAAHEHGVIHRDIKPANLMLTRRGLVKIGDFGIALANHDLNAKLTSKGQLVGTPGYLSPEILSGNPVDQRSDIYALGVALFEMLTGRTPFADLAVYELMQAVMERHVPDVREFNPEVDAATADIVATMLAKDPAQRYQNMRELIYDLEKHPLITAGGPIKVSIAAATASSETMLGIPMPITPRVGSRVPTPPPTLGRRASTTPSPEAARRVSPITPVQNSIRPTPALPAQAPAPAESHKPLWNALIMGVLMFAAGASWGLRGEISGLFEANTQLAAYVEGGIVALFGLLFTGYWFGVHRKRLRERDIGIHSLANMKWRECIGLVLEDMRRDGYDEVPTSKQPGEGGTDALLRRGDETVLLGYKHGTAYHLSETNVRDFAGDVKMQGAARGILVTLGVAEPNAPGLAKRYGIELVDGAALWPKVREFLPANIRDHVRLQTAAQTWKTIWIGTAGSLALGVAVFFVANNLAFDENLSPLATAATTSRAAASDATSSAALKKINATAAAMKQVATLTDAELVQRRADALKQITSNAQVGSAGWSSESTLLITLRQSDGADAGLIENVCGILSGYEELHFTRLQLQPPVSSTMPVRWRQCK